MGVYTYFEVCQHSRVLPLFNCVSLNVSCASVPLYKVLEERDLEPVMTKMREQLMSRNVASEVVKDITASVQAALVDQKLKSFTRCASSTWFVVTLLYVFVCCITVVFGNAALHNVMNCLPLC